MSFYRPFLFAVLLLSPFRALADLDAAIGEDPVFDAEHPATVVELAIPSHGERLPGHIYLASGEGPHPTVVLLHGFPGNERNLDVAQALRRFGYNVLYFQYRGAWGGTGSYRIGHLAEDALSVLEYLRNPANAEELRVDRSALSLLGHSLGGFTALATGAQDDDLRCVMALSPANVGLWKLGGADDAEAAQGLKAYADSLFMLADFSGEIMMDELAAAELVDLDTRGFGEGLKGKAVLLMVGDRDDVTPADTMLIPVAEAYREYEGIDLTTRIIAGDHSFSSTRIRLIREILAFAGDRCR
ncbi:MAG: alpha/beta fold hydrolase [Pseudomonadota bacterium]